MSSNKGKVLTDSRDGFSGEHRDLAALPKASPQYPLPS